MSSAWKSKSVTGGKEACKEYLQAQLDILKPKIILVCGNIALNTMLPNERGITRARGKWFDGPYGSKWCQFFTHHICWETTAVKKVLLNGLCGKIFKKLSENTINYLFSSCAISAIVFGKYCCNTRARADIPLPFAW